jgi:hypothetical protein
MRRVIVVFVAGLLIAQSTAAQQPATETSSKQSITILPAKAHVIVQLTDGTAERGRIVSHAGDSFTFRPDGSGGEQTISYASVRSVSQLSSDHSKAKWIIIGVVGGAVLAIGATALALKNHGPVINLGRL